MKIMKQKNDKRRTFRKFVKKGKNNKTRAKRHMMSKKIKKGGGGRGFNAM